MNTAIRFPELDAPNLAATRDGVRSYARMLGGWLKSCRKKRKHWWHASLRPSLTGLTTGVVNAGSSFELRLNLRESRLHAVVAQGAELTAALRGQSADELRHVVNEFLAVYGIDASPSAADGDSKEFAGYSADCASRIAEVLEAVSAAMAEFRAGIREETSPIQLWPHHFDLSMLWLPGEKIAEQDPRNEEDSDKQMNFGFTLGDESHPEPYFYVTAYPSPDGFAEIPLPAGTRWLTEGFTGAVLPYRSLIETGDPNGYLQNLWTQLLQAGREEMLAKHPPES